MELLSLCRAAFPPLDPNGRPCALALRGALAGLGGLRAAVASRPDARRRLRRELARALDGADAEDNYGDVEADAAPAGRSEAEGARGGGAAEAGRRAEAGPARDGSDATEPKKRGREGAGDEGGLEDACDEEDDATAEEPLLLYLPSVRCTCAAWDLRDVPGDLFVTGLRVLFLAGGPEGDAERDDVAIDGGGLALHAVDSLSGDGEDAAADAQHVYCQLAEPMGDDDDRGCAPAFGTLAPTFITEEYEDPFDEGVDGQEEEEEGDASSEENDTIEVYFKPVITEEEGVDGESQSSQCQSIFASLTKLASLNPAGDADGGFGGGGLSSMLALMAGIGDADAGCGGGLARAGPGDGDGEDLVVRFGGDRHRVEHEDDAAGAPDAARRAMLSRLDDLLVVPPEYEIASSEDGQYDDAEESDDAGEDVL